MSTCGFGTGVARSPVVRTRSSYAGARPLYARECLAPVEAPSPPGRQPTVRRERRDALSRQALTERVAVEYDEMPALRLTVAQVRRLFGLSEDVCTRVLDALVAADVLERDADGAFVRSHSRN